MYSFNFPDMLNSNTSNLVKDKEAVKSNIKLLLSSERLSLFGDPRFGTSLKHAIFSQSNQLIVDLLIDEIYTTLMTFIPQIFLTRKDITITTDGTNLHAEIRCVYRLDNTSDLYDINLTEFEGFE